MVKPDTRTNTKKYQIKRLSITIHWSLRTEPNRIEPNVAQIQIQIQTPTQARILTKQNAHTNTRLIKYV